MNKKLIDQLKKIVGAENLLLKPEQLLAYSYDAKVKGRTPSAVARPDSTGQVAEIVRLCNDARFPVIPRGAGTGQIGGVVPEGPALVLELVRMNRILELAPDELLARVEAGVINGDLDRAAGAHGLMYAPDPASADTSTLGGNAATGAGGLRAVKFGVTKHHVLGLTVVLADGRILRTGMRTKKGVVGYDLTALFVGSEGTLGVMTEVMVRLVPKPESKRTLAASFDRLEQAGACVMEIFRQGITPAVMELLDKRTLQVARMGGQTFKNLDGHLLLIEVAGARKVADVEAGLIARICGESGSRQIEVAADEVEAQGLWAIRKTMSPALYKLRPHKIAEDVAVPIPKLGTMFAGCAAIAEKYDLLWAAYGHAGDGNVHANFLIDPEKGDEAARAQKARRELLEMVIGMGGTLSGEHGIGSHKRDFVSLELSLESIAVQKAIKLALDPNNILNPGKIFP